MISERVVHRYKGQTSIYILLSAVADNQLRVQAKAKHEMLANLVLPAFVDELPRTRERRIERRNTFTFQAPSMRTKKDGMYPSWNAAFSSLLRYSERETPESQGPHMSLMVYAYKVSRPNGSVKIDSKGNDLGNQCTVVK